MEQWAAGSLLTKPHILRTDDSATARHEHGAQAECEWHREETELCAYLRAVPDGAIGGWELAHKAARIANRR